MPNLCDHFAAAPRLLAVIVLPVALLLQRVGHFLRHVILVVLGEHRVGAERCRIDHHALRHHALPFTKQIGKDAAIADAHHVLAVGDVECRIHVLADDGAGLHQSAEPDAGAGRQLLLDHVGRRIEEHDGIAQRGQHERTATTSTTRLDPISTRRRCLRVISHYPSMPSPFARSSRRLRFSASSPIVLRAVKNASRALSLSPITA